MLTPSLTAVTHFSSGEIVVAVDDLSTDDLLALLWIKRSAIETERLAAEEGLRRCMWALLHELPASERVAVARELQSDGDPVAVLYDHMDALLLARFGTLAHPAIGAYRSRLLDAVAA